MFALRAASATRPLLRNAAVNSFGRRQYASGKFLDKYKDSNTPLWLMLAGCAGLGVYVYHDYTEKPLFQKESPLNSEEFIDFKLKRVEQYNHNTASFFFELPGNQASLLPVASCLIVKASDPEALVDKKGKPIIRPYTPVSDRMHPGELELLVKKYDNGNASKYIHSLKVGDTLAIKGPIPKFPYKHGEFEEVALIGGGSGITPLWQILQHALASRHNTTKFTLLYSNVSESDILMREQLEALKKQHPDKFNIIYVLDQPPENWNGSTGFIGKELLKEHVASPTLDEKVKVFVCGPPPQVAAIAGKKAGMKQGELGGVLKELGYTEDQVFKF